MSVRLLDPASKPRVWRGAEPRSEAVRADRAPAVVVEPHQQPATTQARWIGRSSWRLVPIVLRWSMGDDSPRWPASRGAECDVRRLGRRTSPEPPSSGPNPPTWNDVEAAGGTPGVRHGRRLERRLDVARKYQNGAGMEESAPFGWRDDDRREEEGEPAGHRHYSVATSAREGGAGFSASEWPGCGSVSVAVRRAEARRGPGRSTFPVTRSGSRAGPFRSIPWWPFGKCREERMIRTPLHRHRPKVRDVVRRMTYSQQPSCLDDARIAFV